MRILYLCPTSKRMQLVSIASTIDVLTEVLEVNSDELNISAFRIIFNQENECSVKPTTI